MAEDLFAGIRLSGKPKFDRARNPRGGVCLGAAVQDAAVVYIAACVERTGEPPTIAQLKAHIGWRETSSATACVLKNEKRIGSAIVAKMMRQLEAAQKARRDWLNAHRPPQAPRPVSINRGAKR